MLARSRESAVADCDSARPALESNKSASSGVGAEGIAPSCSGIRCSISRTGRALGSSAVASGSHGQVVHRGGLRGVEVRRDRAVRH
jgi:hypothetical protein